MPTDDVSLGEVYRAVLRIEEQTIITNGRLRAAESTIAVHTGQIADLRDSPAEVSKKQLAGLGGIAAVVGGVVWKLFEHFAK